MSEEFCSPDGNNRQPPDENKYRLVIQSLSSKRVSHRHLFLGETQRQAEQESLTVAKRQGFRCAPIGGCCQGALEAATWEQDIVSLVRGAYLAWLGLS